ncbi:glutamate formimidoyltransferase [bacterium]|nr:MAG: glutamate formimidoyltransferase [bacterium]
MAEQKIVECVPNFSEGRDLKVIEQITNTIESVDGVELKDVDPGKATNRTVVTFVGSPDAVVEAAFRAIKKATEVIDMRKHTGAHPRMGATDVCPFVPVTGLTMDDCVELAKKLGKRVGEELKIPVYLYEYAATSPERKNLAYIRQGEYEALAEKLKKTEFKPDFGPAEFNEWIAKTGATAIGAREFLIAYNINLNTSEKKYAFDIAFELRKKGRSARTGNIEPFYFHGEIIRYSENHFPCGNCDFVADNFDALEKHTNDQHNYSIAKLLKSHGYSPDNLNGKPVKKPGIFDYCKAIGWFVDEYGIAQISINLTNYKVTPPHIVLEKTRELAQQRGLIVTGSEIVGLVPYPAMLEAGKYYLKKQDRTTGIPPADILEIAIKSMGLRDVADFDPDEKIIGMPKIPDDALVKLDTQEFVDEVSRESPAPGGGSVAALAGSLGSALASMVANITSQKHPAGEFKDKLISIANSAQEIKESLIRAVDEDTRAFNDYLDAVRMPKKTEQERQAREKAIQDGLKKAVQVPLETANLSFEALKLASEIAQIGNKASVSDAGVGAQIALTGVIGGCLNVLINLGDIQDKDFVEDMKNRCKNLEDDARKLAEQTIQQVKEIIADLHAEAEENNE